MCYHPLMWTPLILVCALADPTQCAIPVAPAARTKNQCQSLIARVLDDLALPDTMFVAQVTCYEWPVPA